VHGIKRALLAPVMKVWLVSYILRNNNVPRPRDAPQTHAPGANSDRILLFGSGAAVGWGTVSHDIALPGSLGRVLAARTHRGADVFVVAGPQINVRTAMRAMRNIDIARFDAIIVMLGANDAMRLTQLSKWEVNLSRLLAYVRQESSPAAALFVTGVLPIRSVRGLDSRFGEIAENHAAQMNAATESIVSTDHRTAFIPMPAAQKTPAKLLGDGRSYRHWAEVIGAEIAPRLDLLRAAPQRDSGRVVLDMATVVHLGDEVVRQLGLNADTAEPHFDQIVEHARSIFSAASAAFNLIDGGDFRPKSRAGAELTQKSLHRELNAETIVSRGAFTVDDVLADERFRKNPEAGTPGGVRFWAAFPIEATNGERVGTLSIWDPNPRVFDPTWERPLLRQLALLLQAELCQLPIPNDKGQARS
jgi:lysophospholipase L1-like esterase